MQLCTSATVAQRTCEIISPFLLLFLCTIQIESKQRPIKHIGKMSIFCYSYFFFFAYFGNLENEQLFHFFVCISFIWNQLEMSALKWRLRRPISAAEAQEHCWRNYKKCVEFVIDSDHSLSNRIHCIQSTCIDTLLPITFSFQSNEKNRLILIQLFSIRFAPLPPASPC